MGYKTILIYIQLKRTNALYECHNYRSLNAFPLILLWNFLNGIGYKLYGVQNLPLQPCNCVYLTSENDNILFACIFLAFQFVKFVFEFWRLLFVLSPMTKQVISLPLFCWNYQQTRENSCTWSTLLLFFCSWDSKVKLSFNSYPHVCEVYSWTHLTKSTSHYRLKTKKKKGVYVWRTTIHCSSYVLNLQQCHHCLHSCNSFFHDYQQVSEICCTNYKLSSILLMA